MKYPIPESASIATGAVSALGASACCVLPLALVSFGLGGAWVAQLRELERFYLIFVTIAVAAFGFAFYRLYLRPAPAHRLLDDADRRQGAGPVAFLCALSSGLARCGRRRP